MNNLTIYLDMDEVVADFLGWIEQTTGKTLTPGGKFPRGLWSEIRTHQRMYRDLPIKEGAFELVETCQNFCKTFGAELRFLTAIPKGNDMPFAPTDKVTWAAHYFHDVPVFFGPYSDQKINYCNKGDILIDDNQLNCDSWTAVGGIAHQYSDWATCSEWLTSILSTY